MKFNFGLFVGIFACAFFQFFLEAKCSPYIVNRAYSEDQLQADGYTIEPLTFKGVVVPGAGNVSITGSIEEIKDQIFKMNPHYDPVDLPRPNITTSIDDAIDTNGHLKRGDTRILCNIKNYKYANSDRILQGIQHLNKSKGTCSVGAGPKKCARISCSYNAAIYWCNDNNHELNHACDSLAQGYAHPIWGKCDATVNRPLNGQNFNDDAGFNILIAGAKC